MKSNRSRTGQTVPPGKGHPNAIHRVWGPLEELEPRLVLAAPTLPVIANQTMIAGKDLSIGLDGADEDGDDLLYSVTSTNPDILVSMMPSANRYARLHFVQTIDEVEVDVGDILLQLFESHSPTATQRFITLATNHVAADGALDPNGTPFYSDVVVHRVIPGFMIQTGDAENGDGTGGSPLGDFDDFFHGDLSFSGTGLLAMANSGANSNDSQFFITDVPTPHLDNKHIIFGQMVFGQDVLTTIINLPRDENDRPDNPPRLKNIDIVQSPQDGVLLIEADSGQTGDITVSVSDGHGGLVERTFSIKALALARPADVHVAPGATASFNVAATGSGGDFVDYSVTTELQTATVSVEDVTGLVSITPPADYHGAFRVIITAGFAAEVRMASQSFYVFSELAGDPAGVAGVPSGLGGGGYATAVLGNRLYAAMGEVGLEVFDITDLAAPSPLGGLDTAGQARDIRLGARTIGDQQRTVAFVADTYGGVAAMDVTDPAAITLLDTYILGTEATPSPAVGMELVGNTLYVAAYDLGLFILDTSNPGDLRELSSIDKLARNPDGSYFEFQAAADVAIDGKTAYVSDLAGGVIVLNVSNSRRPRLITAFGTGGSPWGLDIVGKRLYVADQGYVPAEDEPVVGNALIVYNITKPSAPVQLGRLTIPGQPWTVEIVGQTAVLGNYDGGFDLVNIFNPANLAITGTYAGTQAGGVAVNLGNNLILPMLGDAGIVIIDDHDRLEHYCFVGATTILDADGRGVTFTPKNAAVELRTSLPGGGEILEIIVTPTAPKATLKITTARSYTTPVGGIDVGGDMSSFDAPGVNVTGDVNFDGTLGVLKLGDLSEGELTIGARPAEDTRTATAMTFGSLSEYDIDTQTPIKSLTLTRWLDADGLADALQAPSLATLTTKGIRGQANSGHFQADLRLTAVSGKPLLGTAKIAGDLSGADWTILGEMGTLKVATAADNTKIRAVGSIKGVTVGACDHLAVLAGFAADPGTHATAAGQFAPEAKLKLFKVTGLKTPAGQPAPRRWFFVESWLSAASIGSVTLVNVNFDGAGEFGLYALDVVDYEKEIGSVKYSDKLIPAKATWPKNAATFPPAGDMVIQLLA